MGRHTSPKQRMMEIRTSTHIKTTTLHRRSRESRVRTILQFHIRRVNLLTQHRPLHTNGKTPPLPYLHVVGILQTNLLSTEHTNLVTQQTRPSPMTRTKEIHRQVSTHIHRAWSIVISRHLQGIGSTDIQLTLNTRHRRVEERLQARVVRKLHIPLRSHHHDERHPHHKKH